MTITGVDLDEEVKEANQKVMAQQTAVERAALSIVSLQNKALPNPSTPNKTIKPSVPFSIRPAYHLDWEKPKKYRVVKDFAVDLDYGTDAHVKRIEQQVKHWINKGYYVLESEITSLVSEEYRGHHQRIRIVR